MTIRLLAAHGHYPVNAIVTLDAGTEAGLVAAKLAEFNLTGGTPYVAPTLPNQRFDAQIEVDPAGAVVGLVADGKVIAIGGSPGLRKGVALPLIQYVNQANFSISGAGAAKADSYSPALAPQAITLTGTTAAGSANLDRAGLNLNISALDDFLIAFHILDATKVNGLTLFLCSDVSGFTNYYQVQLLSTPMLGQKDNGWNVLGWRKSEMSVTGTPDPSSIKQVRTQVYSATGGSTVTFDSVWANARTRAKAVVIFDDGWSESYDFNGGHGMYTAMKARGLRGTSSIIGGLVGSANYTTHQQIREMHDAGFDLAVHGINYAGTVPNYQNLIQFPTESDAVANVAQNRNFLLSMGLARAADFYVYPQGKYTETLIPQMRTVGIKMARGTYEALCFPYFPIPDYMMKLPAVDHGGKTFAQVRPFIDRAILTGATIIIYGHRIQTAASATGLYVTQSEFEQTLDYLAAQVANIDTVTVSDWKAQTLAARMA